MLKTENLSKTYEMGPHIVQALMDCNLQIERGEFLSIMGPSGSGKSTLMNILGCLDSPSSGKYYLNDRDISSLNDNELAFIRNREIGFVFQTFNLLAGYTALENVALPLLYAGVPVQERRKRALEALQAMELADWSHHTPAELSQGQRQRVAIARSIVNNPRVIFADEPTGNLDSQSGKKIIELFQKLNSDSGVTLVMVTHDREIAAAAQRIIMLKDGRIVGETV